jgi:hypothetical protein
MFHIFLEYGGVLAKADILQVISFLVNSQGIILSCRNIYALSTL